MCCEEKIFDTNIKISRYEYSQFDYKCETNINCSKSIMIEYLNNKFNQRQNFIKFYNDRFGVNWYIKY